MLQWQANQVDPFQPEVNVLDHLHRLTRRLSRQTVTWASGTDSAPSTQQSSWTLPEVGLLSRIYLDFDGGTATAYDLTVGAGAAAVAANGQGPFGIVTGIRLVVNGSNAIYDVSGWGTRLLNEADEPHHYVTDAPSTAYTAAPNAIARRIYNYPVAADGRPRFGLEIGVMLHPENPLGLLLLQVDNTPVELQVTWGTLSNYAALTGGAVATLSLTVEPTLEYFDVPPVPIFEQYVKPWVLWGHWVRETRQAITQTGARVNNIEIPNRDSYLRLIVTPVINGVVNTDAIDDVRLVLNGAVTKFDHSAAAHFRMQRRSVNKDIPAFVFDFFETRTWRDVIRADQYVSLGLELDVAAGTTLGTAYFRTIAETAVDLGAGALLSAQEAAAAAVRR